MTRILAVFAALALAACAAVTERTGLTMDQQLCLAVQAGEANAMEEIVALGLECLIVAPE